MNNKHELSEFVSRVLQDYPDYDKMSLRDARELYMYIEKKEILKGYKFPKHPGSDGYYRIYVSDPTKKSGRKQLFSKTIDELQEKVYQYERGIVGQTRKTFKDTYELALEEKLKYVKDPEKRLSKQNTINVIQSYYRRYFEGTSFEDKYIDTISKSDIEGIVFFNMDRYSLRERALGNLKGILSFTFNLAYEQYWIKENVFERVNFEKFNGMLVKNVDIEKRVHSEFDVKRILNAIHDHQKKKPAYVPAYALELQILIGARRGEIPPLRRIDVSDEYIFIRREQITVKKYNEVPEHFEIVEHTKTYKDRCFPITKAVNEFLNRLYDMLDEYYPDSEFLFPDPATDIGIINNNTVYRFYSRICRKLGIKISREEIKGTHSFRRNAITDVVNASGGNIILASRLFGNSPQVACKNYYTGINQSEALEALNKRKFS